MQTELSIPATLRRNTAAYLDWIQMLSGAALIVFMWCHMLLVASVNLGSGVFDALAYFLEWTYMAQIGGPAIGILFLIHFAVAIRKVPVTSLQQKNMWNQAKMLRHKDTWLWVVQAVSAMVILIMAGVHLWTVLTNLPISTAKSAARIQDGGWLWFYLILLPMAELHVGIGFYRIGVKWGFVQRRGRKGFQKLEYIITGAFLAIGLLTLITFATVSI
ncbi:succinate dehydrogenase/fumarate reductase cytochrome b subunit [Desulfobaculum bizertense]|uniref:Succinate dehydrogenase subunit C n=2 Tax=Desulfobaculum TaxID=1433996 RepID=A0A1T4WJR7_9BACT|nr:succinate dehydrogenase/fumarate reductase cytochrome b subunit [Desulfobaculum bizertense]SKA77417.1 succinate dehydrogenase subunit C [Desulfobaculum bizertense DSM 18034]